MSGDFALSWSDEGCADLDVSSGDFAADEGLKTAFELSLFTDRRAEDGDVLPVGASNQRGWWADAVSEDKIGSRLWLLEREKVSPDVLARAEEYAREALAWLLTDKVASRLDVTAEFFPGISPTLELSVIVTRPSGREAAFRFGRVWSEVL